MKRDSIARPLLLVSSLALLWSFVASTRHHEHRTKKTMSPGQYQHGAVASSGKFCSGVGRDVLKQGGTAVDALVATEFCLSVEIPHSTGIGGGGFAVVYSKETGQAEFLDYRETAPGAATKNMFVNSTEDNSSKLGGLAIGTPGFVKGLYVAWKKYGKLPWRRLVQPAIDLARNGFSINENLRGTVDEFKKQLSKSSAFRKLFFKDDDIVKDLGDIAKDEYQAVTLERIQQDPMSFYTGALSHDVISDVRGAGGIISQNDLRDYKVKKGRIIKTKIGDMNNFVAFPPAGSVVIQMSLDILKGYNFQPSDITDPDKRGLTYHRIAEAFKFAFAYRALLGDPKYVPNVNETVQEMLDPQFAEQIRLKIDDTKTYNKTSHYGGFYAIKNDAGTSHTSILAPNGDAVSCTSSINTSFGSKVKSFKTGIVYNNIMDDFATPGQTNVFSLPPTDFNFIVPGKRPMSSMSPTIITDKTGQVRLVAGGTGGPRIITVIAQLIMDSLWFGMNAVEAVNQPRIHHQLIPNRIVIRTGELEPSTVDFLKSRGHHVVSQKGMYGYAHLITRDVSGRIFAMSDKRRDAEAAGY